MANLFAVAAIYILAFIGLAAVVAIFIALYVAYHYEINMTVSNRKEKDPEAIKEIEDANTQAAQKAGLGSKVK